MFRHFLSVDHHKRAISIFAADLHALHALTTVIVDANTRNIFKELTDVSCARTFDVRSCYDRNSHIHVHQFLFNARSRHVHGFRRHGVLGAGGDRESGKGSHGCGDGGGRLEHLVVLHRGCSSSELRNHCVAPGSRRRFLSFRRLGAFTGSAPSHALGTVLCPSGHLCRAGA